MRAIFDYSPSYVATTITASSETSGFADDNLADIKPMRRWQSNGYAADQWIKYYKASGFTFDSIFLNRFNFSIFKIMTSDNNTDWTTWSPSNDSYFNVSNNRFENITKDELYNENFMRFFAMKDSNTTAKYVMLLIPFSGNPPLYDPTANYAIGNFLIGVSVDIWGQSQDYTRIKKKKLFLNDFDSGYVESVKMGRTRRVLRGSFNNITLTEYNKIRQTDTPFVIYEDCGDQKQAYLVQNIAQEDSDQFKTDRPDLLTLPFEFTELV